MTRALFEQELHELDTQVIHLGSLVRTALDQALQALKQTDQDTAGAVVRADTTIDDLHLAIEEQTFRVLVLQQPLVGRDARHLLSLVPIAVDLERMGDEAEAIAQQVLRLIPLRAQGGHQSYDVLVEARGQDSHALSTHEDALLAEAELIRHILEFGHSVEAMIGETMKAFAGGDTEAARRLWEEDKMIDRRSYDLRRAIMALLEAPHLLVLHTPTPHMTERIIPLLWIMHALERIADHCTNICERIVFMIQGETTLGPLPEVSP